MCFSVCFIFMLFKASMCMSNVQNGKQKPATTTSSNPPARNKPPRDLKPSELRVIMEGYDPSLDRRLNGKSGK